MMYHVNNDGDVKQCRATKKPCLFTIHGGSIEETQVLFEESMGSELVMTVTKTRRRNKIEGEIESFDKDTFYGKQVPRDVQFDALNGVAEALKEDDSTQLVAACGTGKTYMHRQLLRQAMEGEEASGVGVILTSSIRLAHDTADDLRPTGGYDESFGKFGEDYEVIEVHSDARPAEGRQSVRADGVISVDRIYQQMDEALKAGKKVVIVSTYDSVSKVQEAQARFEDQERVSADLLIHDEAHNVLGQQKPTTVADDDNDLTAYVGFHNEIPGSLQARKRLYSTATPIIRENESDKESTGSLEDLVKSAEKMKNGDQYERITVYSDDPMVGKLGGFISQEQAIDSSCLAKPSYEIRESLIKGAAKDFSDPVVDVTGQMKERSDNPAETDLNPNTYGALVSTLNAMTADAEGDKNVPTNVLAYVGSINQSESFKKAFREVALIEAKGMSLEDAEKNINSVDEETKRRARMRLLAAHAHVKAAHSRTDPDSIRERKEAFEMFKGNAVKNNEWTPHKRVLANVNIFSEGVSISEIDTVVISDDDKLNEKSMTQAIGRAIRIVPGNDVKKYGHVIIPSVSDETGKPMNSSSVNLAAYTSTRVERGTIASKLRGQPVSADETTRFKVHKADGTTEDKLAKSFAQNSITNIEDLAVAAEFNNKHIQLLAKDKSGTYKNMTRNEQLNVIKSAINESLMKKNKDNPKLAYLVKIQSNIAEKSSREIREISRNARVVSNALSTGDISSLNPKIAEKLISSGILSTNQKVTEITTDEKKSFLKKYSKELSYIIMTKPSNSRPEHTVAREMMPDEVKNDKKLLGDAIKHYRKGAVESESVTKAHQAFESMLEDKNFVNTAFTAVNEIDAKTVPVFGWLPSKAKIEDDRKSLDDLRLARQRREAEQGEQEYTVEPKAVRKTGELNALALRKLLNEEF